MTILCKLKLASTSNRAHKQALLGNLVTCAFYRALCFGQVLHMHEKALEEIHYVVEHRNEEYLPSRLRKSAYFEFLLTQMKQTSVESMRREGMDQGVKQISLSAKKQASSASTGSAKKA